MSSSNDDSIELHTELPTKRAKVASLHSVNSEGDIAAHSSSSRKSGVVSIQDMASLDAVYGKVPEGKTACSYYGHKQLLFTNENCVRVDIKTGK